MRVILACLVCRLVTFILHKMGRGATTLPGRVALKVKRNVLYDLSKNVTEKPPPAALSRRDLRLPEELIL